MTTPPVRDDMPPIPSKWRGRQGTRHIVDVTLGGRIVFCSGRKPRDWFDQWNSRCTVAEWDEWVKKTKAKIVEE